MGTLIDSWEDGDWTSNPTWTEVTGGTANETATVKAEAALVGNYGLELWCANGDYQEQLSTNYSVSAGDFRIRIKCDNVAARALFIVRDSSNKECVWIGIYGGSKFAYYHSGGTNYFTITPSNNTEYILRGDYDSSGPTVDYYIYDSSGSLLESHTGLTPPASGNTATIRLDNYSGGNGAITTYWDYLTDGEVAPPSAAVFMTPTKFYGPL